MTVALTLAAAVAGFGAGWLHFSTLSRVADLFVAGRMSALWLQLARLALLAGFLVLCALGGAPVLAGGAVGVLAGRALVLRRAR